MRREFINVQNRIIKKMLSGVLIVNLTFANFLYAGNYFVSYAANVIEQNEEVGELDKQTDATLNKNVKIDAFFEKDGKNSHYNVADINKDEVAISLNLKVQHEGYLKNATVTIQSENEEIPLNYKLISVEDKAEMVQSRTDKNIYLRQINEDSEVNLKLNIAPNIDEKTSKEIINQNSKIIVNGTYMDNKGKETPIEKDISLNLGWKGEYEIKNDVSIVKYIPLNIDSTKKVFVQYNVKTGLVEQENMLPVKNTNIEMLIPQFNSIDPEKIDVEAKSTLATNGLSEEKLEFSDDNWKIDKENGLIKINVENNEDENGNVKIGSGNDEYLVTFIYPEEAYNSIKNQEIKIGTTINTKMKIYSNTEEKEIEKNDVKSISLKDPIGKLLSIEGKSKTEKIGKGKMYANINNEEKSEITEFETSWQINAGYIDNLENIQLTDEGETAKTAYGQQYDISKFTKFLSTTVNKDNFLEVLGEDGSIKITDENGATVGMINNATVLDQNGNYIINYLDNINQIRIETSKPIKEGNLVINNKKAITGDLPYAKPLIETFSTLTSKTGLYQKEKDAKDYFKTEEGQVEIPFEDTTTKAKLSISKQDFSTLVVNKDIEFKIELGNNNSTSDLYADPMFDIELPNYIQDVDIKEYKILYDDELIIDKVEKLTNSNGGITLRIQLDGIQTKFSDGKITNGTNIILKTDVKLNILTPNKTDEIKMYFYNLNTKNFENMVQTENGTAGLYSVPISYSSPTGMLSISNWSNYEDTGKYVMSVNQGPIVDQIDVYKQSYSTKMKLFLVNNTGNVCDNISMLVRIPAKGNKAALTGEDLGTTFDTQLIDYIKSDKIDEDQFKVYYSENSNATRDLSNSENTWVESPENLNKIKSCLIVGNNYQMQPGEMVSFSYNLLLPANITYNNNIMSNFATYFTELASEANIPQEVQSDIVGLTTGKGPELNITQEVEGANEEGKIGEERILKYKIKVTNSGTESAKDVVITDNTPKYTNLVESNSNENTSAFMSVYYIGSEEQKMSDWNVVKNGDKYAGEEVTLQWKVDQLAPGESVEKTFELATQYAPSVYEYYEDYPGFTVDENGKAYITTNKFNADTNTTEESKNELTKTPEIDINNIATVTASNFQTSLKAEDSNVTLESSDITIEEIRGDHSDIGYYGEDEEDDKENADLASQEKEVSFSSTITNKSENEKTNIYIEKILPEGLEFINAELATFDSETGEETDIPLEYDEGTRKISANVEKLEANKNIIFTVNARTMLLEEGVYEKQIVTNTTVSASGMKTITSNDIKLTVVKPNLQIAISSNNENQYLNDGEEVEYTVTLKNVGTDIAKNVELSTIYSKGLKFIDGTYNIFGPDLDLGDTELSEGVFTVKGNIDPGASATIKARFKVRALDEDTASGISANAEGDNTDFVNAEPMRQIILKSANPETDDTNNNGSKNNSNNNSNNSSNGNFVKNNRISGTVWIDENENGKRDQEESFVPNTTVMLIDSTTGGIAKNNNNEDVKTTTNELGGYEFKNLKEGKYLVIFLYDTNVYRVTDYQKTDVGTMLNSDAIESEVTIEGKTTLAGVTDTIDLQKSISNIDLGLVQKSKFDLKLDKTITKISVQNKEGTKVYNINNRKLSQVPIGSKQLKNSVLAVEYSIKVTNEGNVAGVAKNIVDYMPKQLNFNSELNPSWFIGNDNNIYTTTLADVSISPGETKEVKLVLTQKVTENSTGIVNNTAEIKEAYNEYALKDKDSTPGNRAQGEDDMSSADIVITIRTGGKIVIIGLIIALIILSALAIIVYILKNKTKDKKKFLK